VGEITEGGWGKKERKKNSRTDGQEGPQRGPSHLSRSVASRVPIGTKEIGSRVGKKRGRSENREEGKKKWG